MSTLLERAIERPSGTVVLLAGGVALVLGAVLAVAGTRLGWIDRHGGDADLARRKPRRTPVPLIGGPALLATLAILALVEDAARALPWPAMLAAFALGLLDDRLPRGLDWRAKLAGQAIAAALLAWRSDSWTEGALVLAVAIAAQNAANTFDNADGALTALAALALRSQPAVLGALLGFLPANLLLRRRVERAPLAYLGDSGSHLIGILWAWSPSAWPALLLPLLDLARLVRVRARAGDPPWRGDRRHLAHRLASAGLPPLAVVLVLVVIAAPAALVSGSVSALLGGAAGTLALFLLALRVTPEPPWRARPCRRTPAGR